MSKAKEEYYKIDWFNEDVQNIIEKSNDYIKELEKQNKRISELEKQKKRTNKTNE